MNSFLPSPSAPTEDVPSISPHVELTPKTRLQKRNERGETPLHVACIKGDLKTATYLVEQGADINATDHAGEEYLKHELQCLGNITATSEFCVRVFVCMCVCL